MEESDDRGPPEDQSSWAVTDTETTGLEERDQAIEWAIAWPDDSTWSSLFRPTVPVSPGARAEHHITDRELARAHTFAEWLERCGANPDYRPFGAAQYVVAHNWEYDHRLLLQTGLPENLIPPRRICTYRCSRHLWPEAPSHKNQVLRYHLELRFSEEDRRIVDSEEELVPRAHLPHRALYDAIVSRALVRSMLETHTLHQLERLTRSPVLLHRVGFGKNFGKLWSEVDPSYLRWIIDEGPERVRTDGRKVGFNEDIRYTSRYYYNRAR